jgi:dTDP-glucose 4,6-dehydratase
MIARREPRSLLVTGGCGFIGTALIRHLLGRPDFSGRIVNVDSLTYAGNPANLEDIQRDQSERYQFVKGDIRAADLVQRLLKEHDIDCVIHLAAETHVDRSIRDPDSFVATNVEGTVALLEAARRYWDTERKEFLFHHVSTDEVYGTLPASGSRLFVETTPYAPRSPYAASKAAADHFVKAFGTTYGLPVTVSNCSNNYGPFQFPEKLIPLVIGNLLEGVPIPVYGDGLHVRDWLHVEDHVRAIWAIVCGGRSGESYNVGGGSHLPNIRVVERLCDAVARHRRQPAEQNRRLITFVEDRRGHDRRYAIDFSKLRAELGWAPTVDLDLGIDLTVDWYLRNQSWVKEVRSGEYLRWVERHYGSAFGGPEALH